jgi:hypothetical protein
VVGFAGLPSNHCDLCCLLLFVTVAGPDYYCCPVLCCVLQVAAQQGAYVARMINRGYTMGMCRRPQYQTENDSMQATPSLQYSSRSRVAAQM